MGTRDTAIDRLHHTISALEMRLQQPNHFQSSSTRDPLTSNYTSLTSSSFLPPHRDFASATSYTNDFSRQARDISASVLRDAQHFQTEHVMLQHRISTLQKDIARLHVTGGASAHQPVPIVPYTAYDRSSFVASLSPSRKNDTDSVDTRLVRGMVETRNLRELTPIVPFGRSAQKSAAQASSSSPSPPTTPEPASQTPKRTPPLSRRTPDFTAAEDPATILNFDLAMDSSQSATVLPSDTMPTASKPPPSPPSLRLERQVPSGRIAAPTAVLPTKQRAANSTSPVFSRLRRQSVGKTFSFRDNVGEASQLFKTFDPNASTDGTPPTETYQATDKESTISAEPLQRSVSPVPRTETVESSEVEPTVPISALQDLLSLSKKMREMLESTNVETLKKLNDTTSASSLEHAIDASQRMLDEILIDSDRRIRKFQMGSALAAKQNRTQSPDEEILAQLSIEALTCIHQNATVRKTCNKLRLQVCRSQSSPPSNSGRQTDSESPTPTPIEPSDSAQESPTTT
eukprot:GILK01007288.1.p1 GENE.GILK01007288.1~~GILK01007288.1.p1  ORF type:complete len:516 (-),score=53.74 GILK01007288.1:166-1713(-)